MTYKVFFFQTARDDYPVKDFIEEQDITTCAKISRYIKILVDYGPFLKPPYSKKLRNKLYELRISGKVEVRIFYTMTSGQYYLLHAFKKKTQKTPDKEMKIALDRQKELI